MLTGDPVWHPLTLAPGAALRGRGGSRVGLPWGDDSRVSFPGGNEVTQREIDDDPRGEDKNAVFNGQLNTHFR